MTAEQALAALGFTDLESRLYCELLRQGPMTGYKLAQVVAKAPANTYQALKTLAQKGGVIVSERSGDAKTYRPVPAEELLSGIGKQLDARVQSARTALEGMEKATAGELVYQLQSVAQVLERARTMFAQAQEIVLFDFFPGIYEVMAPSILEAEKRGVLVAGITYDPAHDSPTTPYNGFSSGLLANLWPGLGMIVIADGAQQLIAQISRDMNTLMNGIWTDSTFMSATYHSALAAEIRLTAMRPAHDPLRHIALFQAKPPGLRAVIEEETD